MVVRRCLLFVLSFVLLSTGFSTVFSSQVSAYGPRSDKPYDQSAWESRMDTLTLSQPWRDQNYIVFDYDGSSSITMFGNDASFSLIDGGDSTIVTAANLCRWDNSSVSSPGCNPMDSSYSFGAYTVYTIHLTDAKKDEYASTQPELLDYYSVFFDEPSDKPTIRPNFTYQLNNKSIKAHDQNFDLPTFEPDPGYTFVNYQVEWSLFKCTSFDDVTNICDHDGDEADLVDHQILNQDSDYSFDVTDYSDYVLWAQYLVQQCYRYPSYPATPDYCFYVDVGTEIHDYTFTPTKLHLLINGQSISGSTGDMVCDVAGFCADADIICTLGDNFVDYASCEFNKQTKLGLINPSINALKALFNSMIVPPSPTCSIPLPNVPISSGETFPLSQYSTSACTQAKKFRDAFPLVPLLLNFMMALTCFYLIVRIVNTLLDDKDHDVIVGVGK